MINIRILCVGKLKERYWVDACNEYLKRLKAFSNIEVIELSEEKISKHERASDVEIVKYKEGKSILSGIKDSDYVISLEIQGKQFSSPELSKVLTKLSNEGNNSIVFVIGGSFGLSQEVSKRANLRLSFSPMTFPHQMMRVILLEQIYRSFMIERGTPYHK